MAEQIDLTVADQTNPGTTVYRRHYLMLDWEAATVILALSGDNGTTKTCIWQGTQATEMMTALNTANLSTKSLTKRAFEKAIADGKLPASATVSGVPDK